MSPISPNSISSHFKWVIWLPNTKQKKHFWKWNNDMTIAWMFRSQKSMGKKNNGRWHVIAYYKENVSSFCVVVWRKKKVIVKWAHCAISFKHKTTNRLIGRERARLRERKESIKSIIRQDTKKTRGSAIVSFFFHTYFYKEIHNFLFYIRG